MGFVTVKDFGLALGVNGVTVRQRIVRGKLVKNGNGLIDVNDVTNFAYVVEINGGDLDVFKEYYKSIDNTTNVKKKINKPNKNLTILKTKEKQIKIVEKKPEIIQKNKNNKVNDDKGLVKVVPSVETTIAKEKKVDSLANVVKETAAERLEKKKAAEQRASLVELELRKKTADVVFTERQAELKQYELEKKAGNTLPLDITTKIIVILTQTILNKFLLEVDNMVSITVEELGGNRADTVRISNKLNIAFGKIVENAETETMNKIENAVSQHSEERSRGERK